MDAVVFDLDGVLVDSERTWDEVRRAFAAEHGGVWPDGATVAMQGMSTPEWGEYLVREVGVRLSAGEASSGVIAEMARRYEQGPPVLPGAVEAVRAVAERWPVAIASSSPPVLIQAFLEATGLGELVRVAVSSEQAGAGKPAPDVYLLAARGLGVEPGRCAAVEDSTNGLKSARAAGMAVYAIPNPDFPPSAEALEGAVVLGGIGELVGALTRG